jgi:bifunctional non-homologous end joining protein LigD
MWRSTADKRRPPGYIEPRIPMRVSKPPVGPEWVHEIKHDGYRLIARKRDGRVRLFTRRGNEWTQRYPRIAAAVAALRSASAVIRRRGGLLRRSRRSGLREAAQSGL